MKQVYDVAHDYLGMKEFPGAKHNPQVVKMFADVGHDWVQDDETPWCAAFVGSVLAQCGMPHTGGLNARSYMQWGDMVPLSEAQPGDVVVFWRKDPTGPYGHVAFFDHMDGDSIFVLGGNQGNRVSIARYPKGRLLGVRRMRSPKPVVTVSSQNQRKSMLESKTNLAAMAGKATAVVGPVAAMFTGVSENVQLVLIGVTVAVVFGLFWFVGRERRKAWAKGWR